MNDQTSTYQLRPTKVQAVQWFPDKQIPEVKVAIVEQKDGLLTQVERIAMVNTVRGIVLLSPGDWIVYGTDGSIGVFDDAVFRQCYEPSVSLNISQGTLKIAN